jgi:hypothetical protein
MSVILGKGLIFEFSKIAMLFRGVTVGPPRVHLGEVRGATFKLSEYYDIDNISTYVH